MALDVGARWWTLMVSALVSGAAQGGVAHSRARGNRAAAQRLWESMVRTGLLSVFDGSLADTESCIVEAMRLAYAAPGIGQQVRVRRSLGSELSKRDDTLCRL